MKQNQVEELRHTLDNLGKIWLEVYNLNKSINGENTRPNELSELQDIINSTQVKGLEIIDKHCTHTRTFKSNENKVVCDTCYQELDTPF